MRRFFCCVGLLVILGINLFRFTPCIAVDINVELINCTLRNDPFLRCTERSIITEIGETPRVSIFECGPCTLTVNTTRQNRIRFDIDVIRSQYRSYIVHDGVSTFFSKDVSSCYITFPTNELDMYIDRGAVFFRITTAATYPDSLDSPTNATIVTDCEGLIHVDAEKEPDVNVDLICSDPECTKSDIITEIGNLHAVHTSSCESCKLRVNTTIKNRIRLDIDSIQSLSWYRQSYIVHSGVLTAFTKNLASCYVTFPTNNLEVYMDRYIRFRVSTEATNQDSFDLPTKTTIYTDCVGLAHFDAEKKSDVNVDINCYDPECSKSDIITEFGGLLAAHTSSSCGSCKLTVNTRQNGIRLDIDSIQSSSHSYIVHNGVLTGFTKYLTSCYMTFPTNELEIYLGRNTDFRISTESTNQDNLESATNTTILTDCVGLVHFDAEKEPAIDVDFNCSDPECKGITVTEIGELLAVDTSVTCRSCKLAVNTTRHNTIRLYSNSIIRYLLQLYIVHGGVLTVFTEQSASCYVTFPTNKLEIYTDRGTQFRISTKATNQDSLDSATNTTVHTDCERLLHFDTEKETADIDVVCSSSSCRGTLYDSIITEIDDVQIVNGRCVSGLVCTLTVNARRQKRIRFSIISIQSQFSIVYDRVVTQFTENPGVCYITFPTNEMVVYFTDIIKLIISTEEPNHDSSHWNTTSDCAGLVHIDSKEVHVIEYVEMELYTENNYREIQSYMKYAYGTDELRGALPPCPYNCTCSLYNQQLKAHCDNKTSRTLLLHNLKGSDNLPYTFDASKIQLKFIGAEAFKDLKFIDRLILNKNLLTRIEFDTFSYINLIVLEMADNMITELELDKSIALTNLLVLDLHGNRLTSIPSSIFHPAPLVNVNLLGVLDMSNNSLSELLLETSKGPTKLNILILDKNNITTLYPTTFKNVSNLSMLYLDNNKLTTVAQNTFPNGLRRLHLSGNQLSELNSNIFQTQQFGAPQSKLQELTFSKNDITFLPQDVFCYTPNLQRLSLADNLLQNVDLKPFANLKLLTFLNISKNNLKSVLHGIHQVNRWNFCNSTDNRSIAHLLPNMQNIDLSNNEIQMIEGDIFREMPIIQAILIGGNPLQMVDKKTFASLKNETKVLVDDPATCCFIERAQCSPQKPKPPYLTCLQLLPYPPIKVCMWIFGLFALFGNLSVLLWRCKKHGKENIIQVLLIRNLAASDLVMGVYMLIIASADAYYQQYFPSWSNDWRNGPLCKLAGTLSVLSSEASVFFVALISIDRFLAIKFPFQKWRFTRKSTVIVVICLWSLALLLSVLPVSFSGWNHDFYDVSEVCIGLPFVRAPMYLNKTFLTEVKIDTNVHINTPGMGFPSFLYYAIFSDYDSVTYYYSTEIEYEETYTDVEEGNNPGLYFSIVLFLGINLVCFLVVAVTYIWIFIIIYQSNRRVRISRTAQEITLAKRMGAIIITDFMCWAPIIVIGILVQSAILTIHPVVYVYIVVFLLPINSALNPYIYTIAIVLSDYLTRNTESKNAQCHTKNNIGLTREANENALILQLTTFSHQPKSLETKAKPDAENDNSLVNSRTENVPKLALTSFSHQSKSLGTATKSDAENDIGLVNSGIETVRNIASNSFSHQPKSLETGAKSDAESDTYQAKNGTNDLPNKKSTSFSVNQPEITENDAKSDVENDI